MEKKNAEKKKYESPTMTVVEMNVDTVLLQCSDCIEGDELIDGE